MFKDQRLILAIVGLVLSVAAWAVMEYFKVPEGDKLLAFFQNGAEMCGGAVLLFIKTDVSTSGPAVTPTDPTK